MGLWSDYNGHLVGAHRHELDIIRNSAPYYFLRLLSIIVFAFYFTVLFVVVVCYTSMSQSPWQSSSPSLCSRCEGKRTDGYFIPCHFWIVNNVPARDCLLGFLGFQSRVCFKLLQSVII